VAAASLNTIRSIHLALGHLLLVQGIAIGSMVAGMRQVRKGLSAVDELRTRLLSVHRGEARDGRVPV
jgi:hypothetical protein